MLSFSLLCSVIIIIISNSLKPKLLTFLKMFGENLSFDVHLFFALFGSCINFLNETQLNSITLH